WSRSVEREIGRIEAPPAERFGLAPHHAVPQPLGLVGERVGGVGVDDPPPLADQLRLELARTPSGVPGEEADAVDRADRVDRLGVEVDDADPSDRRLERPRRHLVAAAPDADDALPLDRTAREHDAGTG